MEFSDTTNKDGLLQDVQFLTDTTTTEYPAADVARNINHYLRLAASWIYEADSLWTFDDSNLTDLPELTTTLVDSQADYALPSTTHKIIRVEVKDNGGNYIPVKPLDISEIPDATTEFEQTDGLPAYYDIRGDSIWLYPAPAAASVTLAAGLKLYISRDISAFVSTDTTKVPGFKPETCHRILSLGAALDYWLVNDPGNLQKLQALKREINDLKKVLQEFHGARNMETKVRLKPKLDYRI